MQDLMVSAEYLLLDSGTSGHRVVLVGSERLGEGDPALGRRLMLAWLAELSARPLPPATLILYNEGVKWLAPGSPALEDLVVLAHHGADLMLCADSLEHYQIPPPLAAGRAVTMAEIADCLMRAAVVIRP